jgi:hypothetical protein
MIDRNAIRLAAILTLALVHGIYCIITKLILIGAYYIFNINLVNRFWLIYFIVFFLSFFIRIKVAVHYRSEDE